MKIQNIELHNYRSILFVGKISVELKPYVVCAYTNKQNNPTKAYNYKICKIM